MSCLQIGWMEYPYEKTKFIQNLNSFEKQITSEPKTFLSGIRSILVGWATIHEGFVGRGLQSDEVATILAEKLSLTHDEATKFVEMYQTISSDSENKPPPQRGGARILASLRDKFPWIDELIIEAKDIWNEQMNTPTIGPRGGDQHMVRLEFMSDEIVGQGLKFVNTIDRINEALSRRIGVWAIDRVRPIATPNFPIPSQLAVSLIVALIELIRMVLTILPESWFNFIVPVLSAIMALLEVGRGDWKHAVLTMYGSMRSRFWGSMKWKMILNTLMLVSPETKEQLISIAMNTPREIFRTFIWWTITFVMPKQEVFAKSRDILYMIAGQPISGIKRLEIQDFYKLRNIFTDSSIWCFTPAQIMIRKIVEGDPYYVYLLPESTVKAIHAFMPWPYRKPLSIGIKTLMGVPVLADPEILSNKCGKGTSKKMYELLQRILDNKERIKFSLPEGLRTQWQKFIDATKYIDEPDELFRDSNLKLSDVWSPVLELKGPLRSYFQPEFLEQLIPFVKANNLGGFAKWIRNYPKEQILNLDNAVSLLDPIVMQEAGNFLKQQHPTVLKIVGTVTKNKIPPIVKSGIDLLQHMDNPAIILDEEGATLNNILAPILNERAIVSKLDPSFYKTLKNVVNTNDRLRFLSWISTYPKDKMFALNKFSNFTELWKEVKSLQDKQLVLHPSVQRSLQRYALPSVKKRLTYRSRYRAHAKTRRNRR